jgi:hypothetical protein
MPRTISRDRGSVNEVGVFLATFYVLVVTFLIASVDDRPWPGEDV